MGEKEMNGHKHEYECKRCLFLCIQGSQFEDSGRRVDQEEIRRLQALVKTQSQQVEAFRREIDLLTRKGGNVLPPGHALLPPFAPMPSPMQHISARKPGQGHSSKYFKAQNSGIRQEGNQQNLKKHLNK